ncbi:MAG: ComEC/Rec2 family competence protein, partial [Acutalibacteraceae bacterium]
MKRPLTVAGFALGAGAFSAAYFSTEIALFLCSLCVLCFILSLIIKRFRKAVLCLILISLAVGLVLGSARLYSLEADAERLLQKPAVENAQFIPEKTVGENQTIGQLILSNGEELKAFVNGKNLKPFEVYRISGTLESLADSFKNYCYSRQISVQLYAQSAVPLGRTGGNPLFYTAYQVQSACSDKLYTYLPHKEASIIDALLLGNRLSLDRDLYYDFRTSGVAHIAVVSGMHLSVISSIVFMLCCFITRKRRLSSLIASFAVICFMLTTGFSLSVVRAGIMCIIMLSGYLFSRQGDTLNSLGFAVLLITLVNPLSLLDVGFQLSVMATLGIITLSPYIVKSCSRYIQSKLLQSLIITPVAISLSAFIATAPITFVNFDFIGVYFLFTNLLLTFAV